VLHDVTAGLQYTSKGKTQNGKFFCFNVGLKQLQRLTVTGKACYKRKDLLKYYPKSADTYF
jgi:hypothetical protein